MEVITNEFYKNFILVYNKVFSVMLFTFNMVDLYVVTINCKPWMYARKVCKCMPGKCVSY